MKLEEITSICKALGDSNRLQIVEMLTQGEKCACNILDEFEITQPTMSHHMKILCDCGLVKSRREGKWCHYSIDCNRFREFKSFITDISCCDEITDCGCSDADHAGGGTDCGCSGTDREKTARDCSCGGATCGTGDTEKVSGEGRRGCEETEDGCK